MTPDKESIMMTASEIAGLLGWRPGWFSTRKKHLIADHAMPAPLPGGRWHRATLMRWLESYGEMMARKDATLGRQVRIAFDREKLTEKYVGSNAA